MYIPAVKRLVLMTAAAAPGLFASLVGLTVVQGLLPLAGLVLASRVVDAVAGRDLHSALLFLGAATGVAVLAAATSSSSSVLTESFSETVRDDIAERIHLQSASIDLAYYEDPSFHDTLHRAQREGTWRAPRLALGLSQLAREAAALVAMGALLATLRWWLAAILVLVSVPGLLVRLRFSHRLFGLQTEAAHAERAAAYHNWLLTGSQWATEVRLLGLGLWLRERFSALRLTLRTRRLSLAARRARADAIAQALAAVALFGTFAYLAKLAVAGGLTIGAFVMYFGAVQRGLSSLQGLLSSLASLYEDRLFLRNLDAFLDLSPRVVDPAAPRPFPAPIREGIRLDAVTFRYAAGQRPALDGVTLEIPAGKVLALVGLNGSGKSTLVKLLLRLYDPESGSVTADGVDLRAMTGADVRRRASTLLQDYGRFAFTARENVVLGEVDRLAVSPGSDPRLLRAAGLAGALADVESLPRGWDTVLGNFFDDGRELSAGQWQKLALARALYRDEAESPLLIFDEPSASLDPLAERDFVDRLVEAARGRTTVLVSHRFSSVRSADLIAVLDAGRLVESGRHEDLVRAGGLYARMFDAQADPYR